MDDKITSPCISICKTDPLTGYCYGCGRTNNEKIIWKDPKTLKTWKEKNLKNLQKRLSGWQKETFKQSYNFKKKTGITLIKKKLLETKNS